MEMHLNECPQEESSRVKKHLRVLPIPGPAPVCRRVFAACDIADGSPSDSDHKSRSRSVLSRRDFYRSHKACHCSFFDSLIYAVQVEWMSAVRSAVNIKFAVDLFTNKLKICCWRERKRDAD